MSQTEQLSQPQSPADVPQIAGNLWWDDVRQGMGLLFAGLALYLIPFLFGRYLADWFNAIFWIASAVLIILGLKMAISVPAEAHARMFAIGALGAVKLTIIGAIVLWLTGMMRDAGIALLVIGLLANLLVALFIRNAAGYLRARSLSLLAMQYVIGAVIVSAGIVVATLLDQQLITDGLTLLLIGVQLFLVGNMMDVVSKVQRGLAPEASVVAAPAGHEHAAAAHTAEPNPIPAVPPPYFSDKQWEMLETSDKSAGRAVIGLMTAIFIIGVVLYSIIAILAA